MSSMTVHQDRIQVLIPKDTAKSIVFLDSVSRMRRGSLENTDKVSNHLYFLALRLKSLLETTEEKEVASKLAASMQDKLHDLTTRHLTDKAESEDLVRKLKISENELSVKNELVTKLHEIVQSREADLVAAETEFSSTIEKMQTQTKMALESRYKEEEYLYRMLGNELGHLVELFQEERTGDAAERVCSNRAISVCKSDKINRLHLSPKSESFVGAYQSSVFEKIAHLKTKIPSVVTTRHQVLRLQTQLMSLRDNYNRAKIGTQRAEENTNKMERRYTAVCRAVKSLRTRVSKSGILHSSDHVYLTPRTPVSMRGRGTGDAEDILDMAKTFGYFALAEKVSAKYSSNIRMYSQPNSSTKSTITVHNSEMVIDESNIIESNTAFDDIDYPPPKRKIRNSHVHDSQI